MARNWGRTWALIATAILSLTGCAGATPTPTLTIAPTATPTASPTPSARPTPTASPTATPEGPLPLRMGTLVAGQYRTNRFEPTLVFTLPEGWSQFFPDEDDEIFMGSADAALAISRAAQVVDPVSHGPVDAPEDLLEWLTQHPAFDAPEAVAIRLGGVDSHYVDLPGPNGDTKIFSFPGGDFHIPPGVATRFYVVPLDGSDISFVIVPSENGGTIEAAIEAAHPIVESLEIVD